MRAWACMASNCTESLVLIDDVTEDKHLGEVYREISSAQIQPISSKLIAWHFILQVDSYSKQCETNPEGFFFKPKKWNILQ